MAYSKKRAAPTAASQRPAKKRKSAEASLAKMKEIVDDEDAFSEDEKQEFRPLASKAKGKAATNDDDAESDAESEGEFEGHDMVAGEAVPVVAPGFRLWKTSSKLASKGELSQVSKFDEAKKEFSHFLKVKNDEEFTLMPLIVTQGPYKGRRVFMLEPTKGFRFMDFPPEIRNQVYSYLVEADDGKVNVRSAKKVHEARRPIMGGQIYKTNGKSVYETHALFSSLLRTSKQILNEAAPILYGTNHLHFKGLGELKIFLDRIGSMRKYLRHIHIGQSGFQRSKARSAFTSLKEATQLRTLSFHHENICQDKSPYYSHVTSMQSFVWFLDSLLKTLRRAHEGSEEPINVLDIVRIEWDRCHKCADTAPAFPESDDDCAHAKKSNTWFNGRDCREACKNTAAHCKEVEEKLRKMFAKELKIEE